jgi:diguanylate cyclase (GGDEF)-like protein
MDAIFTIFLGGVLLNNYAVMSRRAEASEAELGIVRDLANTDPLTGVKSKHAYAEWEMRTNARLASGDLRELALAVCDVNGLKYINDTQGHKAGDAYILSASVMICELFQHSPVFRIGGDEFCVILQNDDLRNRDALARQLREAMTEISAAARDEWEQVHVALGIAVYDPQADQAVNDVVRRADELMYEDKRIRKSGR